mgnify:CR=1 FL=1
MHVKEIENYCFFSHPQKIYYAVLLACTLFSHCLFCPLFFWGFLTSPSKSAHSSDTVAPTCAAIWPSTKMSFRTGQAQTATYEKVGFGMTLEGFELPFWIRVSNNVRVQVQVQDNTCRSANLLFAKKKNARIVVVGPLPDILCWRTDIANRARWNLFKSP